MTDVFASPLWGPHRRAAVLRLRREVLAAAARAGVGAVLEATAPLLDLLAEQGNEGLPDLLADAQPTDRK